MLKTAFQLLLGMLLCFAPNAVLSKQADSIEKTKNIITEVVKKSFPELKQFEIRVKPFESKANYFQSQFSITKFLTFGKLKYNLYVNPKVFNKNAPEEGIQAIVAHELAHILYYSERNRFELLGLVSLVCGSFTANFERRADLEAISRGYGTGLIKYRQWLYQNIPSISVDEKKRNYFTPEEIEKILQIIEKKPEMLKVWQKKVPKNLIQILETN